MKKNRQKPKRHHHHVWQRYLGPWTTTHGVIWCLQDSRIFSTGTPSIAVEKDFYKLHHLTRADITLIKVLFDHGHPRARRTHAHLLNALMAPFQFAEQVKHSAHPAQIDQVLDDYACSVLEDYHASIEASFIPSLESALKGDIGFYEDERCIPFLNYLCTQYMRTKGVKERTINLCNSDKSADLTRVWNVIIHMFATNIGASLFVERKRRKLTLVRNTTDVPFVTGDQPAINLKGTRPHPPESLSIYYPISPELALLLGDVDEEPLIAPESLSSVQASMLNEKLSDACYNQVFSQSEASLKALHRR